MNQTHQSACESLKIQNECLAIAVSSHKALLEIAASLQRNTEEESIRVQAKKDELRRQQDDFVKKETEINKKHSESEFNLKEAKEEKQRAVQLKSDAESIDARNKIDEDRINTLKKREQEIIAMETNAKNDLKQAQVERSEANDARKSAEAHRQEIERLTETAKQVYEDRWPACLAAEKWFPLRQRLLDEATKTGNAALVVAAFYRFCAAKKSLDPMEICYALQDLGKRLYLWTSHNEVASIGAAFNDADRMFSIRCASPDKPVEEWMNYQPGLGTVKKVCSWAVSRADAGGIFRAVSKAGVI